MQAYLYANPCKICQHFININNLHEHLSSKKCITETVEFSARGTNRSVEQFYNSSGAALIRNNFSMTCMAMFKPDAVCVSYACSL